MHLAILDTSVYIGHSLTVRRHGATVVTANLADFEPLARELRIPLLPAT